MPGVKEFTVLHVCLTITFIVIGLIINLLQLLLLLLLPRRLFHRCNYYLVAAIYGYLLCLADWWGGSRFTIYCSDEFYEKLNKRKVGERQLVVANHHTELDWLYCWQLADRGGLLGGCRALVKNVLKFVPVIGWSSWMTGDVFLSRSWEKDKADMAAKVAALDEEPNPTWLFVFPEGTRLTAAKLKASQEFASSRGLPHLDHHLVARTKGFCLMASSMAGGLLDLTFVQGEHSAPPTLLSLLTGRTVDTRVIVREFDLESVPKEPEEASAWLHRLWQEKDKMKELAKEADWQGIEKLAKVSGRSSPARPWSLLWFLGTNIGVLGPLIFLVGQGGFLTWVLATLAFAAAWLAFNQLVAVSKIKKE